MAKSHASDFELATEMRIAVGRMARRIKQLYEEGETTFSETSVLSRLEREGVTTPRRLADGEHVRPQAIVAIVTNLEQRGLVARSGDPDDRRQVLVRLTPKGRQALSDKSSILTQSLAKSVATSLNRQEREQLAAALPLIERLAREV
jgi:DNA-binding MarR family transcriptional regulator